MDAFQVEFDIDGSSIGTQSVDQILFPNDSITLSQTWTATAGTHTIEVTADSAEMVSEVDEGNNILSQTLPEILDPAPPELVSVDPQDGALLQQLDQIVITLFDQHGEVDDAAVIASIEVRDSSNQLVTGTVSESSDQFTFTPAANELRQEEDAFVIDRFAKIRLRKTSGSDWKNPDHNLTLYRDDETGNMIDLGGYASLLYWNLTLPEFSGVGKSVEIASKALALRNLLLDRDVVFAVKDPDIGYFGMTAFYPDAHIANVASEYQEDIAEFVTNNEYRPGDNYFSFLDGTLDGNAWDDFIKLDLRGSLEFTITKLEPDPILAAELLTITFTANRELSEKPGVRMMCENDIKSFAENDVAQSEDGSAWEATVLIPGDWGGKQGKVTLLSSGRELNPVGQDTFPIEATERTFTVESTTPANSVEAEKLLTIIFTTDSPISAEIPKVGLCTKENCHMEYFFKDIALIGDRRWEGKGIVPEGYTKDGPAQAQIIVEYAEKVWNPDGVNLITITPPPVKREFTLVSYSPHPAQPGQPLSMTIETNKPALEGMPEIFWWPSSVLSIFS